MPCEEPTTAKARPDRSAARADGPKRLWAASYLWAEAPKLEVEEWLTEKPKTEGKVVLIEFWATWCPPCRRSIHLLNEIHETYPDDVVVIGISDETRKDVEALKDPAIKYYSAIDTQARTKNALGVFGIPHVIILQPEGYVVWEGFPLLKGHELTAELVGKIVAVAKKAKQSEASSQ